MIIPFRVQDLLEVNPNINPTFNCNVIEVENFYKNYDMFFDLLQNMPVPIWKHSDNGGNFKDYYDCRPILTPSFVDINNLNVLKTIKNLIHVYFNVEVNQLKSSILEFNYYKNLKKNIPNCFQHYPHKDFDFSFNCIIYMDKVCSGGTALYTTKEEIKNLEQFYLLYDVSNIPKKLIISKPNKLVIFKGDQYHGGFIQDHNCYLDNWRINQILFVV